MKKRILSFILCISLVMCNTLPSFASENVGSEETTETKIVEQLKKDLGEEKASEILLSSEYENEEKIITEEDVECEEKNEVKDESSVNEEEVAKDKESVESENDENEIEEEMSVNDATINEDSIEPSCEEEEVEEEYIEEPEEDVINEEKNDEEIKSEDSESKNDEEVKNEDDELENDVDEFVDDEKDTEIIATNSEIEECEENIDEVEIDNEQLNEEPFEDIQKNNKTIGFKERIIEATISDVKDIVLLGNGDTENTIYWEIVGDTLHFSNNSQGGTLTNREEYGYFFGSSISNSQKSSIITVQFDGIIKPLSIDFSGFSALSNFVDMDNLDTSQIINMNSMFYNCSSLTTLDVTNFNTSQVEYMSNMFAGCSSLTSLDVSNFDTSNVIEMGVMFYNCSSLSTLDVTNFNTEQVTQMHDMFNGCSALTALNVSGFVTSQVVDMDNMFRNCSLLTVIDVSNFDTSQVEGMDTMFSGCSSIISLNLSGFDTSSVERLNGMFENCSQLTTLDATDTFDTTNVSDSYHMFAGCNALVGGNGTPYDSSHIDKEYARIDGAGGLPGYFTEGTTSTEEYTVSFDMQGHGTQVSSQTIQYNHKVTMPASPSCIGYTFGGWYKESGCTNQWNFDVNRVTSATTLYAKWTVNTYTLTFDLFGVSATAPSDVTKTYGTNVTLPSPTGLPSGYTFVGWYKENTLTNQYTGNEDLSSTQGDTITLYAKWRQQIVFDANGHGTAPASIDATSGDIALPYITCTGYIFGGWYDTTSCDGTRYGGANDTYTVSGPVTMYAKWTAITYTINYNANDGTVTPTSDTKTYGENITLPTPTKIGYTFAGWYSNTGLTTAYDGTTDLTTTDNANVNIYAKWTANTYTISYDVGGHATAPANTTKIYGTNYNMPTLTGITSGYTFVGWYKENSLTNQYTGNEDLSSTQGDTVTVYAKWKARVTYNTNGRGTVTPTYVDVVLNEIIPSAPTMSSVVGYTFNGWYKENGCTNEWIMGSDVVDEPKVLYAKWTVDTYNVTLNTNGGTINSGNITTYTYGVGATLPTDITNVSNVFKGWYDNNGFTGSPITSIANNATGDKEYFAKWNPSYTVTFNLTSYTEHPTGVTPIPSQNIESGYKATRPDDPTAAGYGFLGWYREASCTTLWNFNTDTITSDTTIYAKWHAVQTYTFNFNTNGHGTAPATQYVVEDTRVTNPGSLTAEGYTFIRWYESDENVAFDFNTIIPAGSPNTPRTLYAKWQENTYSITYNTNGGSYIGGYTPTTTRLYTQAVTLPTGTDIEKHAFTLDGWYEDSSFNTVASSPYGANVASDKTLYAKWTQAIGSHIITFNANGGSGEMPTQGALDGETITLISNTFTRSGYNFSGWIDTNGVSYTNGATVENVTTDLVLNAQWTAVSTGGGRHGGSGGGGGGGGGGGTTRNASPMNNPSAIPTTTHQVNVTSARVMTLSNEQVVWTYDPITNNFKLSMNNGQVLAANGFYSISKVETIIVNDVPVANTVVNTYCFDQEGNMMTGWVQTIDSGWYFFDTNTASLGAMIGNTWKEIDGKFYYFDATGKMLENTVTPDGYMVGADGALIQ